LNCPFCNGTLYGYHGFLRCLDCGGVIINPSPKWEKEDYQKAWFENGKDWMSEMKAARDHYSKFWATPEVQIVKSKLSGQLIHSFSDGFPYAECLLEPQKIIIHTNFANELQNLSPEIWNLFNSSFNPPQIEWADAWIECKQDWTMTAFHLFSRLQYEEIIQALNNLFGLVFIYQANPAKFMTRGWVHAVPYQQTFLSLSTWLKLLEPKAKILAFGEYGDDLWLLADFGAKDEKEQDNIAEVE